VHDEGPYGELTGMYGGGRKHNPRVILHFTTYREGGIDQHATIGGAHPGYTLPLFLHHDRNRCQCSTIREYPENLGMRRDL
jgi:3-polyprenyl-4-hydroxybenzoate decarboxylase